MMSVIKISDREILNKAKALKSSKKTDLIPLERVFSCTMTVYRVILQNKRCVVVRLVAHRRCAALIHERIPNLARTTLSVLLGSTL